MQNGLCGTVTRGVLSDGVMTGMLFCPMARSHCSSVPLWHGIPGIWNNNDLIQNAKPKWEFLSIVLVVQTRLQNLLRSWSGSVSNWKVDSYSEQNGERERRERSPENRKTDHGNTKSL